MIGQCIAAAAGTICIFLVCASLAERITSSLVAQHVVLKILLAGAAAAAMALWPKRAPADWALRRPAGVRWRGIIGRAIALGAITSMLVLAGGGRGLQRAIGTTGLLQTILVIWILSSLSEELLTRGWLQGVLHRWRDRRVLSIAVPALVSGLVFGAMHLGLYFKSVDPLTATVVVISATTLGIWAGVLRNRFNSLAPPVVAHVTFNVGGAVGGALYTITYRIVTGHFPPHLFQ
jgi:membrane protease YdiL (CAAX protease family)